MQREARRPRRWLRRTGLGLLLVTAVGAIVLVRALATIDTWFFDAMDPGPFDGSLTPPTPDYSDPASWAALPELDDGADVALPELPAVDQAFAPADVFYVHPTTWLGPGWNGPIDDETVVEATERGATLIQASAFNACCAVYAPRYRQAHGRAYIKPDAIGAQAVDVAYADVFAAFDAFLARTGERPFIIAGHSQGSILAGRLLRERVGGTPLQERLVAAWLPGAPLRPDQVGGLPVCAEPDQTSCVAAWNARGPDYEVNGFEFDAADPDTMTGRICVNPISWQANGGHVPAERNSGGLFFDTDVPSVKPAFADAQCDGGSLVVRSMGDPERDVMSRVLLWMMGPENYHPIEYQLFYVDLRRNAAERVAAFAR
jgi:hypothetical protein